MLRDLNPRPSRQKVTRLPTEPPGRPALNALKQSLHFSQVSFSIFFSIENVRSKRNTLISQVATGSTLQAPCRHLGQGRQPGTLRTNRKVHKVPVDLAQGPVSTLHKVVTLLQGPISTLHKVGTLHQGPTSTLHKVPFQPCQGLIPTLYKVPHSTLQEVPFATAHTVTPSEEAQGVHNTLDAIYTGLGWG